MDSRRELVINLLLKNVRKSDIIKKLKPLNIGERFIYRTIKRFKETGSFNIKKETGRKRTVRTKQVIKRVKERFRRNPAHSARSVARQLNISKTSTQLILKKDLGLKGKGLTIDNFKQRLIQVWNDIPPEMVRAVCSTFFRKRKRRTIRIK